jgi:NAD(P)-dependent dehydrogenase (short-subunit alcohol dehydrogenase family)
MSDTKKRSLSGSGRARRRFLEGSALAAVGTSAAVFARAQSTSATAAAMPANCPTVPTPMKDVEGKVAFITGGNSGIGLGVARAFTDAGMKVAITYRTKANLDSAMEQLKGAADRVHAINVDVTDRAAMEKAADEVVKRFGKVHAVVANAGVALIGGISKASYEDWDWGMNVNLNGVFNTIHSFLPRIQSHGEGGAVVATSSLAGLVAHGIAGVYTVSKYGVVGLMEALRHELLDSNIAVTVFCPGIVNTNIGSSARNRPGGAGAPPPPPRPPAGGSGGAAAAMQNAAPGMDALEAGQRVLRGMQNNDLYVLTTPEFEHEFQARGDAILASLPMDVNPSEERIRVGSFLVGKTDYARERDKKRCERARAKK